MIHQASKQPPLQEAVQALPSPTSWGGGHSHIKFAIVLMESNSNPTREKDALGIHQASKQPPRQEAVGGHSLTNFETVLMDSVNSYSIIAFSGVQRHFQQQPFFLHSKEEI